MLSAFPRFSYLGAVLTYLRLRSAGFQHGCSPLPGCSLAVGPAPRHCPSLPSASMLPCLYGLAATVSSAKAPPHQGCGKLILPAAWPGPASPLVPGWLWRHTTDLVLFIVHLPLRPGHGRAFVTTCQVELNACLPQNTEETNVYSACTS